MKCEHDLKVTEEYIFCKKCGKRWYEDCKQVEFVPDYPFIPVQPSCPNYPNQTFDPWRTETTITYNSTK